MASTFDGDLLSDLDVLLPLSATDPVSTGAPAIRQIKRYLVNTQPGEIQNQLDSLLAETETPIGTVITVAEAAPSLIPNYLPLDGSTIGSAASTADYKDDGYETLFKQILNSYGNDGTPVWEADQTVFLPSEPIVALGSALPPETATVSGVGQNQSVIKDATSWEQVYTFNVTLANLSLSQPVSNITHIRWKVRYQGDSDLCRLAYTDLSYTTDGDPMVGGRTNYSTGWSGGSVLLGGYVTTNVPIGVTSFTCTFKVGLQGADGSNCKYASWVDLDQVSATDEQAYQYIRAK